MRGARCAVIAWLLAPLTPCEVSNLRPSKLYTLLWRSMIVVVALQVLNTVLLASVLLQGGTQVESGTQTAAPAAAGSGAGPSAAHKSQPNPSSSQRSEPPAAHATSGREGSPLAVFFEATLEPLKGCVADLGLDSDALLPTAEELEAAGASGSLDSAAAQTVLTKMRAGYAQCNMPFPDPVRSVADPVTTTPNGGEAPASASGGGADHGDILRAYFSITVSRLERAAAEKGEEGSLQLPSEEDIQAAVTSGSHVSDASKKVLEELRAQYERMGMSFPEPPSDL